MNFLNHLKLWQKLLLLVVAMAIPTGLLGGFYLNAANGEVSQARNELQGAHYAHQLGLVLAETTNHRSQLFALLTGDHSRASAVAASEARMKTLMHRTAELNATDGSLFGVSSQWHAIERSWNTLIAHESTLNASHAVAEHDALIQQIMRLGHTITTRSALNVDPSPQTSALIRVATRDVPDALIAAGEVQWYATSATIKGYLGGADQRAIEIYHHQVIRDLTQADHDLNGASEVARTKIRPLLNRALAAFNTSFALIRARILNAKKLTVTPSNLFKSSHAVNARLRQLLDASYASMDASVRHRLAKVTASRAFTVGVTLLALLVGLVLSWAIARTLAQLISKAITVFERIAAGHYDNRIDVKGKDEANQVLRALEQMQTKLRTQIETERAVAATNARIRQALDSVSSGVMVADPNCDITYVNPAIEQMLGDAEMDIRKAIPGFTANKLCGTNIDSFHKNPSYQRQMLAQMTQPHRATVQLAGHTFPVTMNPVTDENGERIGTILEWFDRTQEVAIETQMQDMLDAVVAGQLRARIDLSGKNGFLEAMSRGVNKLADNMTEVISRVKQVTSEVHRGAGEISAGNINLSQRTEEQASSLEETASSMEEMTTTVKQNADNAGQANELALAARQQAEKGGAVVNQAVSAMSGINDASKRISDIIGVIDEIAFQTNLLALNAAVEAARAGEQGRGFAVVASEVRSLAGRSATAAKEIKELIQDSVRKVEDGSVLVTQSGETLEKIVGAVKKVSDIVAEIAAASREQSSGIEQVNRAVGQMDELTQQNAALVEQATAASQSMVAQASGLNEMLARFDVGASDSAHGGIARSLEASEQTNLATGTQAAGGSTRIERRRANRPWSSRTHAARPATPTPGTRAAPKLAAVASQSGSEPGPSAADDDDEWQEF